MSDGLYQRPSREQTAARVNGSLPGAERGPETETPVPASHYCDSGNCEVCGDGTGDAPEQTADPTRNFAVHLSARMRLLGWDQQELAKRAGVTQITATKAVNGTSVSLEFAGKLAALTGLSLVAMIGPYRCGTCDGAPPPGFSCLECGTEGERR